MKTLHVILNAHIDPIWLWPWQAGLDAALATCCSACDRLDTHPDIFFSQGEAWVYDQIERVDPQLFARIREHIHAGRWSIVNGWWTQPDCNLPSGFAMRKQIELGKRYFTERFGVFPAIGYNIDSFGHSAALPGLMREAGQSYYVMMRPNPREMPFPVRLFRWRGAESGPEVLVFRIAMRYNSPPGEISREQMLAAMTDLPEGVEHSMCFVGVGDHGGGPTEANIEWCRRNAESFDGWRLEFSTPERFFDAVAAQTSSLPLIVGELQHHAIGCYSVHRPVKAAVRHAEHRLMQAQAALMFDPAPEQGAPACLEAAWRNVCFHHFHDTLGGTCLPSAYPQVMHQLGYATSVADEIIHHALRRRTALLPGDPLQRLVLVNASDEPIEGPVTVELWLENQRLPTHARLLDADGRPVPMQAVHPEAVVPAAMQAAILFHARLGPREVKTLRLDLSAKEPVRPSSVAHAAPSRLWTDAGVAVDTSLAGAHDIRLSLPALHLIDDPTDTWSHGIDRYNEDPLESCELGLGVPTARGPLMAASICTGSIGSSRVRWEWRVHTEDPFVELRLRVLWVERHRVLKLVVPLPAQASARTDGIMDGHLRRANNGRERPLRDWTFVELDSGVRVGVVCPDVYAVEATPRRLRLTLLRAPLLAHHDPAPTDDLRGAVADQGEHDFRFWFAIGSEVSIDRLERRARFAHRAPVIATVTRGMPSARL